MANTPKTSTRLRRLERQARTLLAQVGKLSEDYDSARVAGALGHVSQAVDELHQAATVALAQDRADAQADHEENR